LAFSKYERSKNLTSQAHAGEFNLEKTQALTFDLCNNLRIQVAQILSEHLLEYAKYWNQLLLERIRWEGHQDKLGWEGRE